VEQAVLLAWRRFRPFFALFFCLTYRTGTCILQVKYRRRAWASLQLCKIAHNFIMAYRVKFFGPLAPQLIPDEGNKVRTAFFEKNAYPRIHLKLRGLRLQLRLLGAPPSRRPAPSGNCGLRKRGERDGRGTQGDPFRPKHLPNPKVQNGPGVKHLGWTAIVSPDRKSYFCEIVAERETDLAPIIQDVKTKWWYKSATSQDVVQQELTKFNPKARLERLKVMAQ
jgi:hypothetical protein